MSIATDEPEWERFEQMSEAEFAAAMRSLAERVSLGKFKKHKRGPKTPRSKPKLDPKVPHVATVKLLE